MKVLILLGLSVFVLGRIDTELRSEEEIGYIAKYAIPLAEKIRKAEEDADDVRINGGHITDIESFPYQAGLLIYFKDAKIGVCSGALVSINRVLTAAHCWRDGYYQGKLITVVLGSDKLFSGGTRIDSTEVILAIGYNPRYRWNDIAIICLPSDVTLSDTIHPLSLPSESQLKESFAGEKANASGFGLTSENGIIAQDQSLSFIELNVVSNQMCKPSYPLKIWITNICATSMKSPKHYSSMSDMSDNTGDSTSSTSQGNICYGDDGGPLVIERDGIKVLIGIASFVSDKCSAGSPAVYTRVTSYLKFIKLNLDHPNKT